MADIEKRLNKSAWRNALVWGTEVDPDGADYGLLPLNAGALKLSVPPAEEESPVSAMQSDLDIVHNDPVDFSLEFDARYEGLGSIIAQVFGTDGLFVVGDTNKYIDFDEGGAELNATLTLGTYTADALCAEMKTQLDAEGALTYTVTYSEATRKFTIAASASFTIRWSTGTNAANDVSDMCGYNDAANDTGASSYEADYTRFHYPKGGPTQQAATSAYLHVLDLRAKSAGLFGTYATEKHDKIHVVPSAKPYKLTFTIDAGLLKVTADFKGNNVIDNSATVTSLSSVTPPDKHNRALFRQLVLRMNAQSGGALGSGDEFKVKTITIEMERTPESGAHESGSLTIIEALEEGKAMVKVTLEFNRMDDDNKVYFANWKAGAEKKMDVVFTGLVIESTYYRYFNFEFPRLAIEDVDYPDENIVPATMVLRGLEADSAPTGMTVTKPVRLSIMNTNTADLLSAD
jgi:hypothetical protein